MEPSEPQDKPTAQCMTSIMAINECLFDDPTPNILEIGENFGETIKEHTNYTFPMDMPYISEMQEKDKILMAYIQKDTH
jgi:hypothetical protein